MRYKVNSDFEVYNKKDYYLLKNSIDNSFIRFTENEHKVYLKFLDFNSMEILDKDEVDIFNALLAVDVIVGENQKTKTKKKKFNIFNFKVKEINPDKFLKKAAVFNKIIFTNQFKCLYIITILLALLSLLIINNKGIDIFSLRFYTELAKGKMFLVYLGILITIGIHELGHALTLIHYDMKVSKIGLKFYFLQLIAYCDLSNLYLTDDKKKKISTYSAGILAQIFCSSVSIVVYMILAAVFNIRLDELMVYGVINFGIAIFNTIPFVKFDGYWILSTICNSYNLDAKAQVEVKRFIKREHNIKSSLVLFGLVSIVVKFVLLLETVNMVVGYI